MSDGSAESSHAASRAADIDSFILWTISPMKRALRSADENADACRSCRACGQRLTALMASDFADALFYRPPPPNLWFLGDPNASPGASTHSRRERGASATASTAGAVATRPWGETRPASST